MSWTPPPPPGSENVSNAATGTPPPPPPSPAPAASLPPAKPKSKMLWIGLAAAAIIALAGYWYYSNHIDVPQLADIKKLVESRLSQPSLSVKSVSAKVVSKNGNSLEMAYTAVAELTEAKYESIPTGKYLSDHGADPAIAQQIQNILARRDIKEILAEAQMETLPASLQGKTLVKQVVAAGKTITYAGQITATRGNNGWAPELTGQPQASERLPQGLGLSQFSGEVLDVDKPENAAALEQLVKSADQNVLNKMNDAIARLHDKNVTKHLAQVQPGTLFKGTATKSNGDVQILYLEISTLNADRQEITAALRNDGGWDDYRRFQGTYALNDNTGEFSIKLNTRSEQFVQNCGPFLDWQGNYDLNLTFDGDALTTTLQCWMGRFDIKFGKIPDDQKAKAIADATDTQQKWLAATMPGKNYQVIATWPRLAWSRNYYFTFTKQERNGASAVIEGLLQDPITGWRRAFSGMLVLNNYRADGRRLRIIADGQNNAIANQRDPNSPFAYSGYTWYPQLDDGRFSFDSSEGGSWHLEFTPYTGSLPIPATVDASGGGITDGIKPLAPALSSSFVWKGLDGQEIALPKAAINVEINPLDKSLGTYYFKPPGTVPKVTGDNAVFVHKGVTIDLSQMYSTDGFDSKFIFFKLGDGKGLLTPRQYAGVLNADCKVDPNSGKVEMDSGHLLGIGKTTIRHNEQDIDAQTQQCTITSKLPSGFYAIMVAGNFYIFEYVAPSNK